MRALQIPKDVIDEVFDALEAAMSVPKADAISTPSFQKLNAAWVRLDEAVQDAEATKP